LEGKLSPEDKSKIDAELNRVKETLTGTDTEAIKSATEDLTKVFYEISSKMYQATGGAEGAEPQGSEGADNDETINPNYKVEDDK
jgi:molecular chaperone DnaK